MKSSALIFEEFYLGVQDLPAEMQAEAYNAYCRWTMYDEEYTGDNLAIKVLLASMSKKVHKANTKYEEKANDISASRSEAGKRGAAKRWHRESFTSENGNECQSEASNDKTWQTMANASKDATVNVNDTVTVNDLKDKKKKAQQAAPVPRTTMQFFEKLKSDYSFSEQMLQELGTWFKYKTERREPYKEIGMKKFLTQISHEIEKNGEDKVIDAFEWSMSNGWKGFYYRKEDKAQPRAKPIQYNNFQQRNYTNDDYTDLERKLANL